MNICAIIRRDIYYRGEHMSKDKSKKKKYKLQVMDIITIVFTAIILGIMGFVLYEHISGDGSDKDAASATQTAVATAAPTKEPTLSDIGNVYGNITNDANVVCIDGREYFISVDDNGDKHIYVTVGDVTTDLIKAEASSLNVITDYITYNDQIDVDGYYVFYINGKGQICYLLDGPVGDGLVQNAPLTEVVFLDGSYLSVDVSGEYVYHLSADGNIGKTSILEKTSYVLSAERPYKSFVLYFGDIYAQGKENNYIYKMPSVSAEEESSEASATPATATADKNESREALLISEPVTDYVLDSDWVYTISDKGIVRYVINGLNNKDTLSSTIEADCINAYNDAIFYVADNHLYTCTAKLFLLDSVLDIGEVTSTAGINISENAIYLVNEKGKLCKSKYDSTAKAYTEFKEMN